MLRKARVQNFKSLRDVELEFGGLTLLIGQNNSGKSAAIESLLYYKEAALNHALSYNDVDDVDFVGYDFSATHELLHRNQSGRAEHLAVEPIFNLAGFQDSDLLLSTLQTHDLDPDGVELSIAADLFNQDLRQTWKYLDGLGEMATLLEPEESASLTGQNIDFKSPLGEGESVRVSNQGLLNLEDITDEMAREFILKTQELITNKLLKTYYITDSRDIRDWDDDPREQDFVGYEGENTVSMLHALRDNENAFNHVVNAIDEIADTTSEVVADMHDDTTMTELVDEDTDEKFNVVASGSGIRRLLPIIVQIAAMEDGSTLIIEEPEISVFPKTQERFLEYIIREIRSRDIQVIMTTHSWTLMTKMMNIVGEDGGTDLGHAIMFRKSDGETNVEKRRLNRLSLDEDQWRREDEDGAEN